MAELAGMLVGDYFLLECLAREGQVAMYRARPTTRGGYDVLLRLFKPPFPDPTNFRNHFATEVEKVWHCHHEHLLPLFEFGTGDDLLYCVTRFPEMETVSQFLKQQPERFVPVERVVSLAVQLCDAVQYLHNRGIVHGNIQPSSIYLRDGQDVLLTNHGMRRAYQEGEPLASLLDEGNAFYVAPEQSLGMACPASDIYALGVLLYRLLGGLFPYDGGSAEEIIWQHTNNTLPSLYKLRPDMPYAVEEVLQKSLTKLPIHRFASAYEFAQALLTAVTGAYTQDATTQEPRRVQVRSCRTQCSRNQAESLLALPHPQCQ